METKDLILRNWQEHDAKALYEMCLDEILEKVGLTFTIQSLKVKVQSMIGKITRALR